MRGSLQELQTFSEMSGLKLNVEKTSCMMFGADGWCTTDNNFGLRWVHDMKVLGVVFTKDLKNVTEINIRPRLMQIEKEIVQWRRRHLTPFGKIAVIKSLLISKLVHLLAALPNPTAKTRKEIEKMFYNFIWGSKRDAIKRTRLTQDYAKGGLRMIDLNAFIDSLKLSWLKRLFLSQSIWAKLGDVEIGRVQRVLGYGTYQLQKIVCQIGNPFWADVVRALVFFLRAYSPTVEDILSESLWFSDHTKFKDKMIRQWDERGLRFINDLFNRTTGVLHSKASLEKQFNLKLTFLCFESLIRSLPEKVRTYKAAKLISPGIPWIIQMVLSKNNFGHFAYDMLVNETFCNAEPSITRIREKWVRDTGINIENDFIEVTNATKATRLKYFHFKIVNRIISTNVFLERIGATDDDSCSFCHGELETLVHLFWQCPNVQDFIRKINQELFASSNSRNVQQHYITLNMKSWFFLSDTNPLQMLIITLAKLVIHESRLKGSQPSLVYLKNKLQQEADIEFLRCRQLGQEKQFESKWKPLKHILSQ